MNLKDKAALRDWDAFKRAIEKSTAVDIDETHAERVARIAALQSDVVTFCKYYFPHYCQDEFANWQKKFLKKIAEAKKLTGSLEVHRSGAKTSLMMMASFYRISKGMQRNTLMVSRTYDNAEELLNAYMSELECNQRYIHDYGLQRGVGSWEAGRFVTRENCSFRAIGMGQSPRGTKNNEIRPDTIIIDDGDDDEVCLNARRLDDAWEWTMSSLFACLDIKHGGLFMVINNRIAKDCIIGRMKERNASDWHTVVNIIELKSTVDLAAIKEYQKHLDVAEFELLKVRDGHDDYDARKKKMLAYKQALGWLNSGYQVTWPERFSIYDIAYLRVTQGERFFEKEYMNNPMSEGKVFKAEWIQFKKLPPLKSYRYMVAYLDPGFKKTATSDTKSWVLVALQDGKYHVRKVFCGQASVNEMIGWGYSINDYVSKNSGAVQYYMEEVFLQDLLYKDFAAEARVYGYPLPVSGDTRSKPDKDARIEATSGYFERGDVYFDEAIKEDHHCKKLIEQYLLFEKNTRSKKDGPDAVEGAIYLLNKMSVTYAPIEAIKRAKNKYKL
jgi:hypothetical protein